MNDRLFMQICDAVENIGEYRTSLVLGKATDLFQNLAKGATRHILEDDIKSVLGVKDVIGADNVGMIDGFHNVEFTPDKLLAEFVVGLLLDDLDGELFEGGAIETHDDFCKGAFTEGLAELVMVLDATIGCFLKGVEPVVIVCRGVCEETNGAIGADDDDTAGAFNADNLCAEEVLLPRGIRGLEEKLRGGSGTDVSECVRESGVGLEWGWSGGERTLRTWLDKTWLASLK